MAAVPPPPAPPTPPVAAVCAWGGDPHMPVAIPASHPLALGTAFLGWVAVAGAGPGAALVSLNTSQMLMVFGARLVCSKLPADLPAADRVTPLTLGLTGSAWTRILNEYLSSGLLTVTMNSRSDLISRLAAIPWSTRRTCISRPLIGNWAKTSLAPQGFQALRLFPRCLLPLPSVVEVSVATGRPCLAFPPHWLSKPLQDDLLSIRPSIS
ncbi:hypothetical protein AB1Y20_019101 [Prymnesium parvum]|uniref:Anaphase-promoting complex subunit 1 n=1 Tax=Prymnesium parvum TaxID=97485 RepID=A0AB34JQ92_PRYPA